eukprot:5894382-Alexandrium_andersonii.AAC.1
MKSHLPDASGSHPTTIALVKIIPWRDSLVEVRPGSQEDPSNQTGWKHESTYAGRWRKNFAIGATR